MLVDAPTTDYTQTICVCVRVYFYQNTIYLRFQKKRLQWCVDIFLQSEQARKMDYISNTDSTLDG